MKKTLAILLAAVSIGNAAVTVDSIGSWQNLASGSSSKTFAHTVSGTNTMLAVVVHGTGLNGATSSVTYADVAMVQTGFVDNFGSNEDLEIYTLINPTTGANNVVYTRAGTNAVTWIVAISFNGVAQTSSFGTVTNQADSVAGTSGSADIATAAGDYVFCAVGVRFDSGSSVTEEGADQSSITEHHAALDGAEAASTITATGTTTTCSYSWTNTKDWGITGFSIYAPAATSPPGLNEFWDRKTGFGLKNKMFDL